MKKCGAHILIAVLCVLQLLSFIRISNLQQQIEYTKTSISSQLSNLNSNVSNIYTNVESMLKKQSSFLESAEYTLGTFNKNDITVPINFTVVPKEITPNTVVMIDINGESFNMVRNGTTFKATVEQGLFTSVLPKVIIQEGEVMKTEQPENLNIYNLKENVIPEVYAYLGGSSSQSNQTYYRIGELTVDNKKVLSGVKFTDVNFVVKVDEDIVSQKKISPDGMWESFTYQVNEKIPMKAEQKCTMTVVATDTLGLSHHRIVDEWMIPEGNSAPEPEPFDYEVIYDKDGRLIYKPEWK